MKKMKSAVAVGCAVATLAISGMVASVPVLAAQKKLTIVTRGGGYHRDWWLATLEAFIAFYVGGIWGMPVFVVVLVVMLTVRPRGLFGRW